MAPQKGGHACKFTKPRKPSTDQPSALQAAAIPELVYTCTIDDIKAKYKRSLDIINKRLLYLNIDGEFEFLLVKKTEPKLGGGKRRRYVKKGGAPTKYILRCFGVYKDNRVQPVAGQPLAGQPPHSVKINNFVHEVIEPVRRLDRRLKTTEFSDVPYINYLQELINAKQQELAKKELIIYIVNLLFKIRDPAVQIQFHTITGVGTIQYTNKGVFVVIGSVTHLLEDNLYMTDGIERDIHTIFTDGSMTVVHVHVPVEPVEDVAHVPETVQDDVFTIDGIKVSVEDAQALLTQQAILTQQKDVLELPEATAAQHDVIYGLICLK